MSQPLLRNASRSQTTSPSVGQPRCSLTPFCTPRHSYGVRASGNWIIKGDNASVLPLLSPTFNSAVRCIYIDPPYNTRESYTHYMDGQEHEVWLSDLISRLSAMWPLLTEDGSLWISIDDREMHYLKVACDELFGRDRFVTTVVWQHRKSRENRKAFSSAHEYILVYAPDPKAFARSRNLLPPTDEIKKRYSNPDDDPRGPWQSVSAHVQDGHATPQQFYTIVGPSGRQHTPPKGRCWTCAEPRMREHIAKGIIWFGSDGNGVPRFKRFLCDAKLGLTPSTVWTADDVGTTRKAKQEILRLFPRNKPFDTPKPESLLKRIIEIATDPCDYVLDAYLGAGTTAAVAHKLGRKYIGIEKGRHALSLCARRLRSVIDGESGGISGEVDWTSGGGFTFAEVPDQE